MSDEKKTNADSEKIDTIKNGEILEEDNAKDFKEPIKEDK